MALMLQFRVIYERNVSLSMGISFFTICPLPILDCKVPKDGMNFNPPYRQVGTLCR
jgi:hypothetical protein